MISSNRYRSKAGVAELYASLFARATSAWSCRHRRWRYLAASEWQFHLIFIHSLHKQLTRTV